MSKIRTIKRHNFERIIKLNNKLYYWNVASSARNTPDPNDKLKVEVYSKNLIGKTDLRGNPYKPSLFFYSLDKNVNNGK